MKNPDSGMSARVSVEGQAIEQLRVNPFPNILSQEEFKEAVADGQNFWRNYMHTLEEEASEKSHQDNTWGLYATRLAQDAFRKSFFEGKITEDYRDTILAEDPVFSTTDTRKIATITGAFEGMTAVRGDYDETISPQDMYELYRDDPSGRSIVRSIAREKIRHLHYSLPMEDLSRTKDILGTDVGVLVPDDKIEMLVSENELDDPVQPTNRFLQKPSSREEMKQMLKWVSGKSITVITSIAIKYQILSEGGPIAYRNLDVEVEVPIKKLSDEEIDKFVDVHFEIGRNIAGGVDYTSYGSEIMETGIPLKYEEVITPTKAMKKLWAEVQVIKRSAQINSLKVAENNKG